jgi:thioredoxin 1
MQRREFIALSAAAMVALGAPAAFAGEPAIYSEKLVAQELAAGKTVLIDFTASWCSSCQAQGRAIQALRDENPAYDAAITFVEADWDTYQGTPLATQYGITRRGSLVILRGNDVIAQTSTHSSKDALKAMLDQAAAAA